MNVIDITFGPFDKWEMQHYKDRLKNDKGSIINSFQKQMIFNLFYKYFGDTISAYGINSDDYIKLMIAAKKILLENRMILLPYIISGKVEKLIGRKTVNKKEMVKLESSDYYPQVFNKYRNEKIIKTILSMISTIISSDFTIIDYNIKEIDGKHIQTIPDIIIEEILMYTLLI